MQSHGPFEILPRHVFKRTNFDNAGAVDQNVDLTEAIDDFANSRLNLCWYRASRIEWSELCRRAG